MRQIFILTISLFAFQFVFAQKSSRKLNRIVKEVSRIEKSLEEYDSVYSKMIDSIKIDIKCWDNKIQTTNHFLKSNSKLEIYFYSIDNKLILIRTVEKSPISDNMFSFSAFYIKDNVVISESHRFTLMSGISYRMGIDMYELFGYNKSFTDKFLRQYFMRLYKEIKPTIE